MKVFSLESFPLYSMLYSHMQVCAQTHTCTHTTHAHYMCTYTHIHTCTHTPTNIYVCICIYIHMHEQPMNGACKKTDIQTHTCVGIPHTHTHVYLLFTVCCHGASGRANQHTSRHHFILFPTSKDRCAGLNH